MSQKQIQSLGILSMSTQDLAGKLVKLAEENPALVINEFHTKRKLPGDGTRISSSTSQGEMATEAHQAALESHADTRTSLTEHLLSQLNMSKIPPVEFEICEKLIYNLDSKGFHFLAPVSLLDKKNKTHTVGILEKCIERIQQFDPQGLCVKNMEESLFVQAKQKENPPELALFILDGRLNFLDPPRPDKIIQKIKKFFDEQKTLIGFSENSLRYTNFILDENTVEEALHFIRLLDPFPARDFSTTQTHFVSADVFIEKTDATTSDGENIIRDGDFSLSVKITDDSLPEISINTKDMKALESQSLDMEKRKELAERLRKAKELIEAISYRQNTILRACCEIARIQIEFFKKGPGHLVPLRLQDIADKLGVHETTVSRMSNSKYIQCEWGLFNIKYFFTNSASTKDSSISRDQVLYEMKRILENNTGGKKLSDQKISELLESHGISIARRTVAKYRSLLNIDSSYNR